MSWFLARIEHNARRLCRVVGQHVAQIGTGFDDVEFGDYLDIEDRIDIPVRITGVLGEVHRDAVWFLTCDGCPHRLSPFFAWRDGHWCFTDDGEEWHPAPGERDGKIYALGKSVWVEFSGGPFALNASAVTPTAEYSAAGSPPPVQAPPRAPIVPAGVSADMQPAPPAGISADQLDWLEHAFLNVLATHARSGDDCADLTELPVRYKICGRYESDAAWRVHVWDVFRHNVEKATKRKK